MIFRKIVSRVVLALNLLVGFVLLLVYVSVYINPSIFWPAPFFGLMYPYIILVNIFFIFYWLVSRKKYFLFSLIIIILGWKHIKSNYKLGSHQEKALENQMLVKVFSYNIKMKDLSRNYNTDKEKAEIIELINQESPDILCLQEMYCTYDKPLVAPTPLQKSYKLQNCNINRGNAHKYYGLGIFSKYHTISKGTIRFENSTNFCIYSDLLVGADTIRIYNVHLQSVGFMHHDFVIIDSLSEIKNNNRIKHAQNISLKLKDAFAKRSVQVNILKEHIQGSPYPVLVCGDFNDTPVSYTYHIMHKLLDDAYSDAGKGSGNTYIGKIPSYRIDYIYHDKNFKTINFNKPRIKSSDHYPVMASFVKN